MKSSLEMFEPPVWGPAFFSHTLCPHGQPEGSPRGCGSCPVLQFAPRGPPGLTVHSRFVRRTLKHPLPTACTAKAIGKDGFPPLSIGPQGWRNSIGLASDSLWQLLGVGSHSATATHQGHTRPSIRQVLISQEERTQREREDQRREG